MEIVIIIAVVAFLAFNLKPAIMSEQLRSLLKDRTEAQRAVIKYFHPEEGCVAMKIMSDYEYEQMVMREVSDYDFKQKALAKLGIDETQVKEVEPIHLENWVFDDKGFVRKGNDNIWRSSRYQISWVFCSDEQVYVYQYIISMADDVMEEHTKEYFYTDITNFSSSCESVELQILSKITRRGKEIYERRLVSTDLFRIVVPGDSFECSFIPGNYSNAAIQGLKTKLREIKNRQSQA